MVMRRTLRMGQSYRGFVGCFNNKNIDTKRRIAKTGIGCEIFRIEKQDFNRFARTKKLGEPIPVEKINNFKYQDMEEIIYTRIFLEVRTAAKQEKTINGKENYDKTKDKQMPYEIEHIYPDYDLYPQLTNDTAFGFLTRGCPRGCNFCHVKEKEGQQSYKVADLSEFWRGQKNIVLCDPNLIACKEWKDLLEQLIDSKAKIDINQGIDIRIMTEKKAELIRKLKIKTIHFAWDRYEDKNIIVPKLKYFKDITGWNKEKMIVFVLTNYDTTIEQDLERIYTLRKLGYNPYVMIYDKEHTKGNDKVRILQRWVNNRKIFATVPEFENYDRRRG